jgi:hypothetical protein
MFFFLSADNFSPLHLFPLFNSFFSLCNRKGLSFPAIAGEVRVEPNRTTPTKFLYALMRALGAVHIVRRVINYSLSSKSVMGGGT